MPTNTLTSQEAADFVRLYGFGMAGPASAAIRHYAWDGSDDRPALREAVIVIQPPRDEEARRAAIRKDAEPMVQSVLNSKQLPLRAVSYDGPDLQPSPVLISDEFFDVDPATIARLRHFVMLHCLPLASEMQQQADDKVKAGKKDDKPKGKGDKAHKKAPPTKFFSRTAWPLPDPTFILTAAIESDDCA